jgi:hypothetical protein
LIHFSAKSDRVQIVTPVRVTSNSYRDDRPTIGIEGLFENFEKPKFPNTVIDEKKESNGESYKGIIQPTSVIR